MKSNEDTRLLSFFKGFGKQSILAPLFKLLEALFDLLVPLVVADIINNGIAAGDADYILKKSMVLIMLGVIGLACSLTAQWFAAQAALGVSCAMRLSLFAHIQYLDFSQIDALGGSTLITRLTSDINQVQSGVNMFLRLFLRSPFIVFGSVIMAFTIDKRVAMVFLAAVPVLLVIVFGIMVITNPMYRKTQNQLDRVLGLTRENLTGVRVVRAFRHEEQEVSQFKDENNRLTSSQLKVGRVSALMNPLTYAVVNLALIAILSAGAKQVNSGILLSGDVYALVNYMSQILVELVKMANTIVLTSKALACAGRVQSILKLKPEMTFPETSPEEKGDCSIAFKNVSLAYENAEGESLSGINFSVRKGETLGIIGGTGSGKSSVVNLIPRFYDPTAGTVELFGNNASSYPQSDLHKKVKIVMQRAMLFSGTIRSNLLWGNDSATDDELWQALETAQAAEFVRSRPKGLDDIVEQGGRNLSGGQRQRLTIARALVGKPEILILDDSASALDYATDASLRKAIAALPGDMTTVIVSQRTSSLQHADKILVLEDGRQAGLGTHQQLLATCRVYKEIYDSQFQRGVKE